jgi:DNA-binding NarL/FixJ family response regulator
VVYPSSLKASWEALPALATPQMLGSLGRLVAHAIPLRRRAMRILIADGRAKVRSALRLLIEQETSYAIVGEASRGIVLFSLLEAEKPDVLLLDWNLPGLAPMQAIAFLKRRYPDLVIISLSSRPETQCKALAAGANAFIAKHDSPQAVLGTLRRFGRSRPAFSAE